MNSGLFEVKLITTYKVERVYLYDSNEQVESLCIILRLERFHHPESDVEPPPPPKKKKIHCCVKKVFLTIYVFC